MLPATRQLLPLQKNLSVDFERAFEDGFMTDCKILTEMGSVWCNKYVLAVRAPLMLKHFCKASQTIDLTMFSTKAIKIFMRYLYAGKTEGFQEVSRDLYVLATRFHLKELKDITFEMICDN